MEIISGIAVAGYRSFGHKLLQRIAPMSKITLVAGQNNSGKSNLLRIVQAALGDDGDRADFGRGLDAPAGAPGGDATARFAVATTVPDMSRRVDETQRRSHQPVVPKDLMDALVATIGDTDLGLLWAEYTVAGGRLELDSGWLAEAHGRASEWQGVLADASSAFTNTAGGPQGDDLRRVLKALWPAEQLPTAKTIPAFRQVQQAVSGGELTYGGVGLVDRLAQLESPAAIAHSERERFETIQGFVRDVLDDPTLTITVPHDRKTINVRLGGGALLPLENMGTGIHQVVILATAASLLTDTLVCVEEPEIHLHPLLQRKLLRYLERKTSNQYLIATHSASMLDAELASIHHITRDGDGSHIEAASTPGARARITADLGYRASDLVQANAIIWVEGPSDRIYVRRWIEMVDPSLIEGIHFSIMFYGGRLLNHLSANDPDVNDFISLRRLNRHVAIVIDSDKTSAQKRVNGTKQRVVDEIGRDGISWVTEGYTIENYVPGDVLGAAIREVHPSAVIGEFKRYDNPLAAPSLGGLKGSPDKIAIARAAAKALTPAHAWPMSLRSHVVDLVALVRRANGLAPFVP